MCLLFYIYVFDYDKDNRIPNIILCSIVFFISSKTNNRRYLGFSQKFYVIAFSIKNEIVTPRRLQKILKVYLVHIVYRLISH